MDYTILGMEKGNRVGTLHFTKGGVPVPVGCGASGYPIFCFLAELSNVWLPRTKQRVPINMADPEHREAVAASLGPLGYRTEPLRAEK